MLYTVGKEVTQVSIKFGVATHHALVQGLGLQVEPYDRTKKVSRNGQKIFENRHVTNLDEFVNTLMEKGFLFSRVVRRPHADIGYAVYVFTLSRTGEEDVETANAIALQFQPFVNFGWATEVYENPGSAEIGKNLALNCAGAHQLANPNSKRQQALRERAARYAA